MIPSNPLTFCIVFNVCLQLTAAFQTVYKGKIRDFLEKDTLLFNMEAFSLCIGSVFLRPKTRWNNYICSFM